MPFDVKMWLDDWRNTVEANIEKEIREIGMGKKMVKNKGKGGLD